MSEIRWRIGWVASERCLYTEFYESVPFVEPYGTVWSMEVAHDTIAHLGVLL